MDNLEKLTTQDTQDEEKHNTKCVGPYYIQANTNNVNNEPFYKQLEVKTN